MADRVATAMTLYCASCRSNVRRGHALTERHARSIRRPIVRSTRLGRAIADGNRPAWTFRGEQEAPAELWSPDAEHGAVPIPSWYE